MLQLPDQTKTDVFLYVMAELLYFPVDQKLCSNMVATIDTFKIYCQGFVGANTITNQLFLNDTSGCKLTLNRFLMTS